MDRRREAEVRVTCWHVRDTGLLTAPGQFRRLRGEVRHHQGRGDPWPDPVTLVLADEMLYVEDVGRWPLPAIECRLYSPGPPVMFILRVPGSTQLLATAAGLGAQALLSRLVV